MRRLRHSRQLSCQQLANNLTNSGFPITRAVIANQEIGKVRHAAIDYVDALAREFEVSITDLIEPITFCRICGNCPPAGFTCTGCDRTG